MTDIWLPELPDLPKELEGLVGQIPAGMVATYGDLAKALGSVSASRWIGSFLLHDSRASEWPSHRVVRSDGSLGEYVHGGKKAKAEILRNEGVRITKGKVDLARFCQREFSCSRPLEKLRRLQDRLPEQCVLAAENRPIETVAGLDVSYADAETGIGGYALTDAKTGELVWSATVQCEVRFPYISSYLAFRELPVLLELFEVAERAGQLADIHMIDGAGIMHPRRSGVATHFGIMTDSPTIGITKKLLAGSFDDSDTAALSPRDVTDDAKLLGAAIRPRESSKKFIWTSPGHRTDVTQATAITLAALQGRRLPEPIYWADRLSRQEARN